MCVLPREVYFELSSRYDEGNISTVYVDALVVQMGRTRPRRRWTDERCDVWGVRLTFLPCASARADGVVRAPVSAACVLALRTRFGTLTTRSAPRACAAATLGNPYTFDGMRTLLRRKCRLKSPIQVRHVLLRQTPPVARGIRLRCRHAREII